MDLERTPIKRLLLKFAVPCVISMLVAALYNIVDQIYIGHIPDIGVFCNAATNVVYPLTLIALAICLMFGDGAAALFSLSLGRKDKNAANKAIGNNIAMQIISLTLLTIISLSFKDQILNLFGVTASSYTYAYDYLSVIILGFPFYMFGQGMNATIRSDGSPKYAMFATTAGAIFNIIFDPIFIFTFNLGIKGAAIATVLGQIVTFLLTIWYLCKPKNFKITLSALKPSWSIIKEEIMLGIASFVTQISIVIIMTVINNLVRALSDPIYGDTIPLAIIGIVMKVFGIVVSICIGIALGGQPIIGYNVGAKNPKRVHETLTLILKACFIVGLISFLIFEFAPDFIISIFGQGDEIYLQFARLCVRIFLGGIILTCLTKASTIFLQSAGASKKSILLSVTRDVIFFVPTSIVIGINFGLVPMLWSAIVADICAAIVSFTLVKSELKEM